MALMGISTAQHQKVAKANSTQPGSAAAEEQFTCTHAILQPFASLSCTRALRNHATMCCLTILEQARHDDNVHAGGAQHVIFRVP